MDITTECREFSRSRVHAHVVVSLESGVMVDGSAADISLRGMRFYTERSLPVGKHVHVRVLQSAEDPDPCLRVGARVARVEAGGVALEFTGVDADSIENLRHLIVYNAADPDQAQKEIEAHVGIERRG